MAQPDKPYKTKERIVRVKTHRSLVSHNRIFITSHFFHPRHRENARPHVQYRQQVKSFAGVGRQDNHRLLEKIQPEA